LLLLFDDIKRGKENNINSWIGFMKFISTRGLAPDLGFCDSVLAGLANDGGLYLPQQWPPNIL